MTAGWVGIVVFLAAVQQFVAPFFLNPFRGTHAQMREESTTLIEPARYAFAIWGPIYILALGYSGLQLFSEPASAPLFSRVAPWAIALYGSSTLWLFLAVRKLYWLTVPLLAAMALFASVALVHLVQGDDTFVWWGLAVAPFGLYAGWAIAATAVNISSVASRVGFNRFGLGQVPFDLALLASATIATLILLLLCRGELALGASVVWALAAIVAANLRRKGPMSITLVCAGAAVLVLGVMLGIWLAS